MNAKTETEISVIQEISSAVIHERNVETLLEKILSVLERKMGMLRGTFSLLHGSELTIEASCGLSSEEKKLGHYRLGEGITGIVAESGRPCVVPDLRKDKRFLNRTGSRHYDRQVAFICVPLVFRDDVIGTLDEYTRLCAGGVEYSESNSFDPADYAKGTTLVLKAGK